MRHELLRVRRRETGNLARNAPLSRDSLEWRKRANEGVFMRMAAVVPRILAVLGTTGCVPVAIGAGGATVADTIAEDNGGDLF